MRGREMAVTWEDQNKTYLGSGSCSAENNRGRIVRLFLLWTDRRMRSVGGGTPTLLIDEVDETDGGWEIK